MRKEEKGNSLWGRKGDKIKANGSSFQSHMHMAQVYTCWFISNCKQKKKNTES